MPEGDTLLFGDNVQQRVNEVITNAKSEDLLDKQIQDEEDRTSRPGNKFTKRFNQYQKDKKYNKKKQFTKPTKNKDYHDDDHAYDHAYSKNYRTSSKRKTQKRFQKRQEGY